MPATEQTWRDQKLLHRIFAVSGVVLLIATIWMLVADHNREWMQDQQTVRSIELTRLQWQQEQAQARLDSQKAELEAALLRAQSQPIAPDLLQTFEKEVRADLEARELDPQSVSFSGLESQLQAYNEAAKKAVDARQKAASARQKAEASEKLSTAALLKAQELELAIASAQDATTANNNAEDARAHAIKEAATHTTNDEDANKAAAEATELEHVAANQRQALLDSLHSYGHAAKFREETLLGRRKFKSADLDAAKAKLDIAVRDNASQQEKARLQARVDELKGELGELTLQYEQATKHRVDLEKAIDAITVDEEAAAKALAAAQSEIEQLEKAEVERRSTWFVSSPPFLGKKWLELPILNAFHSPLTIDNLWHEGNTIDYNFAKVRRFDRCTTCHRSIDKTQPGSAVDPAYVAETTFELILRTPTPEQLIELTGDQTATLENAYGFKLADRGLADADAVTVAFVRPASQETTQSTLAAQARISAEDHLKLTGEEIRQRVLEAVGDAQAAPAETPGLMSGDVIEKVNGGEIHYDSDVEKYLLESVKWGEPVRVTVKRGLPEPYTTHPRMDLFIGSLSPHDLPTFACTICHEGQGSATAFKWASHTPNNPQQASEWARDHGWFDNHHWIFPMFPERFLESSCLKCHHQVTELEGQLITADGSEPADRFLEPPAPKLMHGYDLIRKYGCFGCHEVNGYGKGRTVGPDLRLEPNISEAVQAIIADPGFAKLPSEEQGWAEQLKFHPELDNLRHRLLQSLEAAKDSAQAAGEQPVLTATSYKVAELLNDVESPGELRKVGPSLRRVSHKLTSDFMYDWVRQPSHFRPDTRMPQFFGLWDHLTIDQRLHKLEAKDEHATSKEGEEVHDIAMRYEPVEILGVVTYLREKSQAYEFTPPAQDVAERTPEEQVANGKLLFENRGCLACHMHKDFPDADKYRPADQVVQGPDLSAVADKFSPDRNPDGAKWLYSWIHNPSDYSPRTLMPDLQLHPLDEPVLENGQPKKDADGKTVTRRIDPIADIVAYLLKDSRSDWQPILGDSITSEGGALGLDAEGEETLNELVRVNLEDAFAKKAAEKYAVEGIRVEEQPDLKGAEIELVGEKIDDKMKLMYVGRKVIARYGCYGCHDVPGFEDAKPIGTGLADWGRKDPSRLAFEHITHYLHEKHVLAGLEANADGADAANHGGEAHGESAGDDDSFTAQDHAFYEEAINAGHRAGFIWQKLVEPRSYDYEKTENKKYSERLRMPEFPFNDAEREAVITFVLGLVADPPDPSYVYEPAPRQGAILAGRRVAEKYNCNGCHMFELEKWNVAYPPDTYGEQLTVQTFPFMNAHFTPEQLAASTKVDAQGMRQALLVGLPAIGDADALPVINDFEGDPLFPEDEYDPAAVEYLFELWRPTALDGHPYQTAVLPLKVMADTIDRKTPARGGMLAKYLTPRVIAQAKAAGRTVKGTEAWGWTPPPLVGEGAKVQTDWLHDFLLDPHMIRPEVVLRMPKFNMSSGEASALVNYFAAKDDVSYPYEFSPRRRSDYLEEQQKSYDDLLKELEIPASTRFEDARQIVFNKAGCIQCHAVGDYSEAPRGPDLAEVYKRLRGDYTRRWIANPKRILPYTSMPENFKYLPDSPADEGFIVTYQEGGETKKKKLVHGDATEQLDAIVDLLMNFDADAQLRSPYTPLAKQAAEAGAPEAGAPEAGAPEAGAAEGDAAGGNSGGSE